jgi:tape measure domain-containing protein
MATPDLSIRISAELTEVKAALAGLQAQLRGVGQAANQAGSAQGINRLNEGLQGALRSVRNLVGGFAAFASVVQLVRVADEINTLNARLRLVTRSQEEFNRAQVALFDLAQRTRSSLGETVDLYTRIAQSTKDAGVGQETLLQVVETINQAVQLSGASAQAANAALVQLGQGLGSGTLRGEELNSVLEQTPALADAIAKGMGITRGELRKYGEEGKITGEAVINALKSQRDEVRANFEQLPLTVGQAFTRLRNAGTQLVGAFDQASAGTRGLAGILDSLASTLSSDEFIGSIVEFGRAWGSAFSDIIADATRAIDIVRQATRNFLGSGTDVFGFLFEAIRDLPRNIRTAIQVAVTSFAFLIDYYVEQARFLKDAFLAIFTDDTIDAALARRDRAINASAEAARGQIQDALDENRQAKREAEQARNEAIAARERGRREGSNQAGPRNVRDIRPVLDSLAVTKDATERGIREIEALYQAARISLADYLERRTALQTQAIDAEIAAERRKLAEAQKARKQDDANKAATRIEILQRERGSVVGQAERDRLREQQAINDQLLQLEVERLEQQGQLERAAQLRLQQQYRDFRQRLVTEGNTAGVALIDGLISTQSARARFQEIERQAAEVQQRLQSRLQSLADQRSTGGISADAAASGQREARQQAAEELGRLNTQLSELATRTNDPEILRGAENLRAALAGIKRDGLEGTDLAISNLIASLDQMRASLAATVADSAVSSLENLFMSLGDNSTSASDKIKDFVSSFARSMAQLAARALATFLVLQTLDAIYPGLGRAASAGLSATRQHSGGMAGTGQRITAPAWLFAGAPRFHSGGMVGLKSDEVPAVLQKGEEVLSRDDPRNQANGGGSTRIVNAIDPNLVSDYLSTPSGERTIVNVITRNRGQIKSSLA